jgi:hypothetical protein
MLTTTIMAETDMMVVAKMELVAMEEMAVVVKVVVVEDEGIKIMSEIYEEFQ